MKSKMKSAFAIIAVALMVLVAVVPMVGVFTSESDATAASTQVPTLTEKQKVTVKVKLYNSAGTSITTAAAGIGYLIKIEYGAYSQTGELTDTTNGLTFTLMESSVSSAILSVVDAEGNAISLYSSVTLSNLEGGKTYNASLVAGMASDKVTFAFANGTYNTLLVKDRIATDSTITANYTVYDRTGESPNYEYEELNSGTFIMDDNFAGTFFYPKGKTYTQLCVAVTYFQSSLSVTYDAELKQTVTIGGTQNVLKAKQSIFSIAPTSIMAKGINVTGFKATYDTDKTSTFDIVGDGKLQYATSALDIPTTSAYVYGIVPTSPTYAITLSSDGSSKDFTVTISGSAVTLPTLTEVLAGSIQMNTIAVKQSGKIDMQVEKADSTTEKLDVSVSVDANGMFFKFVKDVKSSGTITAPKFTAANGTEFAVSSMSTFGTSISATVPNTGYSEVSGTVKLTGTTKGIVGKELTITGAKTFGPTSVTTLASDSGAGSFKFAAETGKTITITVEGAELYGPTVVTPGAGSSGGDSKSLAITMSTQKVTLKLTDALGNKLTSTEVTTVKMVDGEGVAPITTGANNGEFSGSTTSNTFTLYVRADVDVSQYKVYFVSTNYTFDAYNVETAVPFVDGQTYTSGSAKVYLQMQNAAGGAITAAENNVIIGYAMAYKNTDGAVIFDYDTDNTYDQTLVCYKTSSTVKNAYQFIAEINDLKVTEESLSATPIKVVYVKQGTAATTWNAGVFKEMYVLTADEEGFIAVQASVDSFTAKLVRNDKETPVAGIKAQLVYYDGNTKTNIGTETYTQNDGSFTVYSSKLLSGLTAPQIEFTNGSGYTFTAPAKTDAPYPVYKSVGVLNTTFMPATDAYTFTFVDADGAKINLHETGYTYSSTITGSEAAVTTTTVGVGNIMTASVKWTMEQDLSVTLTHTKNSVTTTYRTFSVQSLEDDDIADGTVTLVSNQAKYTFKTIDADGKKYGGATISLYKYVGDQDILIDGVTVDIEGDPAKSSYGTGSILLPLVSETDVDTVYGYRATGGGDYMYDLTTTVIDDTEIIVESYSNKVVVYLEDEAGNALAYQPTGVAIYDGSVAYPATVTLDVGYFSFVGDSDTNYSYTITMADATHYTFKEKSKAVDGAVKAKEQVVYGTLSDANGMKLPLAGDVTIQAYDAYGFATGAPDTYTNASSNFRLIVSTAEAATYRATFAGDDAVFYGAYVDSLTTVITTDEEFVGFSAVTANGVGLENATITGLSAYDENNSAIGKSKTIDGKEYLFVEEDEVVYYKATTINDGDPDFAFTFDKESLTNVFVANESYITGSVPYSGKGTGKVVLDLYLLGDLVKEVPGYIANTNKYEYEAILDLSDYTPIDGTAGVAFDSIVAVYSEGGVVIAASPVNPYTTVNNVISPTIESFEIKLDAPSALVARHVSMARVGNTATVSADAKFIVSDDEAIYTDGQYIYTFAGWYVDNELVSHNAVFTFTATEDVVIAPAYTVAYEKISDANAQVDPEIIIEEITKENTGIDTNVLIIGIAAVIVALIAVVYAVIKKE